MTAPRRMDLRHACLEVILDDTNREADRLAAAAALRMLCHARKPSGVLVDRLFDATMRTRAQAPLATRLVECAALATDPRQAACGLERVVREALRDGHAVLSWTALRLQLTGPAKPPTPDVRRLGRLARLLTEVPDPRHLVEMIRFFTSPERDVPRWVRTSVTRRPDLLEGLDDATLEHVHRAMPTPAGWLLLAHRSTERRRFQVSATAFVRVGTARNSLRIAAAEESVQEDRAMQSWLEAWAAGLTPARRVRPSA